MAGTENETGVTTVQKKRRRASVIADESKAVSSNTTKTKKTAVKKKKGGVDDVVSDFLESTKNYLIAFCMNAKFFMDVVCNPLENATQDAVYHFTKDGFYTNTLASGGLMLIHIKVTEKACYAYRCSRNDLPVAFDVVELCSQLKKFKFKTNTVLCVGVPPSNDKMQFCVFYKTTGTKATHTLRLLDIMGNEERRSSMVNADFIVTLPTMDFKEYITILDGSTDAERLGFVVENGRLQLVAEGTMRSTRLSVGNASIKESTSSTSNSNYRVNVLITYIAVLSKLSYTPKDDSVTIYLHRRKVTVEYTILEHSMAASSLALIQFNLPSAVDDSGS